MFPIFNYPVQRRFLCSLAVYYFWCVSWGNETYVTVLFVFNFWVIFSKFSKGGGFKEVNLLQVSILLLLICLWEEGSRLIPMLKYGLWSEVNSQLLALACWWIDLGPCSLEAGIDGWHLTPDLLRRWGLWREKGMAEGDTCLFLLLSLYWSQQSLPESWVNSGCLKNIWHPLVLPSLPAHPAVAELVGPMQGSA